MPIFFITETVTREGMMSVKEAPGRSKNVVKLASVFGVEVLEFFFCANEFDFIMKVSASDQDSVAAFIISLRKSGNVVAKFTRAYAPNEWADLVETVPD